MDLNLTNRTAIVTGGATGLGREFVLSLAKEGVNICFTYMREEEHPERLIETVKTSANVRSSRSKPISLTSRAGKICLPPVSTDWAKPTFW